MARAVAKSRELHCHNCKRTWKALVWGYDENWTKPREPINCMCSTPHIEVLPDWRRSGGFAQVRASQRCAVYLMPDGSVSAPPSNRYDDEVALYAVARGGVRHEFMSVREMQSFQRDRRQSADDDFSDRNLVIDYDQSSILNGHHYLRDEIRRDDDRLREYNQMRDRVQIYIGGERYEEAKRRAGRA